MNAEGTRRSEVALDGMETVGKNKGIDGRDRTGGRADDAASKSGLSPTLLRPGRGHDREVPWEMDNAAKEAGQG